MRLIILHDILSSETTNETLNVSITESRWDLAEMLIRKFNLTIIPLRPDNKIPILKEWNKKTKTTLEELNQWRQENENYNLGLVLGHGIVAIDVDGSDGNRILHELSAGDLPQTVTYTTPSGGMRYLYRILEQDKEKVFKKFVKTGDSEHNECALLGVGQQTVLPFSIHPNGGVYKFVKGSSFDDIPIAYVPEWMKALMIKSSMPKTHITDIKIQKSSIAHSTPSNELKEICSKCPRLQELLHEQIRNNLHEETWFLIMCLLINNGYANLAREFSRLSSKHDLRSELRIDQLLSSEAKSSLYCTTLGCTENDIKKCFKTTFKNDNGEITNSPRSLIQKSKLENAKIGFIYDKDGIFKGINGNIFSRHILENYNIITKDGSIFYMYEDNYWQEFEVHKLKRILKRFFNSFEPDRWTEKLHEVYWNSLILDARDVSELQKSHNYINMKNGLFNLDTMKLDTHDSSIFSTTQLPIEYDPNAQCPTFRDYLDDVFQGDDDLVLLAQEILGYCLCYSTQAQKVFVLLGEGSNGKSLLCNIITALCGEKNVSSISLRNLGKPFMKHGLVDKLLNISTENEMTGENFNTEDIKAISSGDMIQVERKFHDPFQARLQVKMMFSLNRLPYSKDNSYAITRRLIILPFDKTYVERNPGIGQGKVDITLEGRLIDELNGILNFALKGLQRLQANSYVFTKAQRSIDVLEDYKLDINPFLDFVQSCVEIAEPDAKNKEDKRIEAHHFLRAFKEWCYECNHKKLLDTTIKRFLKEVRISLKNTGVPFTEGDSNGKQYFYGITITQEMTKKLNISSYMQVR